MMKQIAWKPIKKVYKRNKQSSTNSPKIYIDNSISCKHVKDGRLPKTDKCPLCVEHDEDNAHIFKCQ